MDPCASVFFFKAKLSRHIWVACQNSADLALCSSYLENAVAWLSSIISALETVFYLHAYFMRAEPPGQKLLVTNSCHYHKQGKQILQSSPFLALPGRIWVDHYFAVDLHAKARKEKWIRTPARNIAQLFAHAGYQVAIVQQ